MSKEGVEPVLTETNFASEMCFDTIAEEVELEEGVVVVYAVAVHMLEYFVLFKIWGKGTEMGMHWG